MNLKKLLISLLLLINFYLNGQAPVLTSRPILQLPPVVPLTLCDKRYAAEMDKALNKYKENAKVDLVKIAEEYMIMLKQHQDLDIQIRQMEQHTFKSNLDVIRVLRKPLKEYIKCKDSSRFGTHRVSFDR